VVSTLESSPKKGSFPHGLEPCHVARALGEGLNYIPMLNQAGAACRGGVPEAIAVAQH